MKIKVEKVSLDDNVIRVDFSSDYGRSSALWVGEMPTLGTFYDVEFDIDDDLVWGESIFTTKRDRTMIALEKGAFVVVGKVIRFEEDGCLSIVVGESVVLLDVADAPENISGLIECHASDVKVYSTNL